MVTNLVQEQKQLLPIRQELITLQRTLQDKDAEVKLCHSEMEAMEAKLKKSKDEWKEAQERMNVLESITTHQKEQIEKEQRIRMETAAARETLESALEDKKQEIAKLQMIISQSKGEVEQLENEKGQMAAERNEMEHTDARLRE